MAAVERVQEALAKKPGASEWLWEELCSLRDVPEIAKELGVSTKALYVWRDSSDERRTEWAMSLKISGDAYASEGKKILAEMEQERQTSHKRLESSHVALASERARTYMKIASARHAEAWGERQPAPVIQVSIQALHLEALKAHGSMGRVTGEIVQAEIHKAIPASFEVVGPAMETDRQEPAPLDPQATESPDPTVASPPPPESAPGSSLGPPSNRPRPYYGPLAAWQKGVYDGPPPEPYVAEKLPPIWDE